MIIKSMSRKEPSFGQLINYMQDIEKSEYQYNVYQNLFSRKAEDLEAEFQQNARHIPKRKNGVYLYHEILSIKVEDKLERKEQKAILRDIAHEYARHRASQNLVFGTLHDDHEEHLHYHLLISSNAAGQSKKTRLSKAQFSTFKKEMEKMVLERYPELQQEVVMNRQAGEKLSNKGAERKRRTGETPQRDTVKTKLNEIFASTSSKHEFFEAIAKEGFEVYIRGNTIGIRDIQNNRNHRLKTLGLLDAFNSLSERIELNQANTTKSENVKTEDTEQVDTHSKTNEHTQPDETQNTQPTEKDQQTARRKSEMENLRKQQAEKGQSNKQKKDQ